ncbi:hypothetical protein JKY79_02255 [Candidatus Babeliales bacterium]|nr:hypothetical protein [Candidatus Babeliales bacterium]
MNNSYFTFLYLFCFSLQFSLHGAEIFEFELGNEEKNILVDRFSFEINSDSNEIIFKHEMISDPKKKPDYEGNIYIDINGGIKEEICTYQTSGTLSFEKILGILLLHGWSTDLPLQTVENPYTNISWECNDNIRSETYSCTIRYELIEDGTVFRLYKQNCPYQFIELEFAKSISDQLKSEDAVMSSTDIVTFFSTRKEKREFRRIFKASGYDFFPSALLQYPAL